MPIHLAAPTPALGGPDGRGWTRLSIGSMGALVDDECALRPRDYSHFIEAQDTRRARYGGYGSCVNDGKCQTCPIFQAAMHGWDDDTVAKARRYRAAVRALTKPAAGVRQDGAQQ